ncbi:hypothetical protein [Dactylosporangium sp. CA-092794]|uniref:hypothetical protein n=1 Tax=Dactylosporangium sp. CA-092794 TaxID=3239929 RepID=UPI003D8FF332
MTSTRRFAVASAAVVFALAKCVRDAWRTGTPTVAATAVARELMRRGAAPEASRVSVPSPHLEAAALADLEFEVDATLREATWRARQRTRRWVEAVGPDWDAAVRSGLLAAFAAAYETRSTRHVSHALLLRHLVGGREPPGPEPFANGEPNADAVVGLGLLDALASSSRARRSVARLPGLLAGRRWGGPVELVVRREAIRQAVRTNAPAVTQAHLLGTSHVLYAIASDGAGTGSGMLRRFGVEPDELVARLSRELRIG